MSSRYFRLFPVSRTKSSTSKKRFGRRRPMRIEPLESKNLLATDVLGMIEGVVALDANNDNVIDAGEEQSAVNVTLYEDTNNNNSYDAGTDTQVNTATTNADGEYEFTGLTSGNYFVVQPAQGALSQRVSPRLVVDGNGVAGQSVDDFGTNSGPTIDDHPPGTPVDAVFSAAEAIGGERDFEVELTSGDPLTEVQIQTLGGQLDFGTPNIQPLGTYKVTWDGPDAVGAGLDATGLGNIDLTEIDGVTGQGKGLCLTGVQFDQLGAMITVRVYTSGSQFSEATIGSVPAFSTNNYFIPFSGTTGGLSFSPTAGGGADFSDVGAIELEIVATQQATNGVVDAFGVFGVDPEVANFINPAPIPGINIVKATEGNPANEATDSDVPYINLNTTTDVTWTYTVTNTGQSDLESVQLNDSVEGTIAASNIISRSINADNILDIGEVWVYQLTGTATEGLYSNTGTVTAVSVDGAQNVTAQNDSHYRGIRPSITIQKMTDGNLADTPGAADVPQIPAGNTVTWTYVVTNTGSDPLQNVIVDDDRIGSISNITNKSINEDNILDPGEVWTYTASGTATVGSYTNVGTVTGTASNGTSNVSASNPSNYVGISQQPALAITKRTNQGPINNGTLGTGPQIVVGEDATFTYVVTNIGDVDLQNVTVEDDNGTPTNTADDFFATYQSGDTDGDGQLDLAEEWVYTAVRPAILGPYRNTAEANGASVGNGTAAAPAISVSTYTGIEEPEPATKRFLLATFFQNTAIL